MSEKSIYLDSNATTLIDPRVRDYVFEVLSSAPGNPASSHAAGRAALEVVELARTRVGALIEANPNQVFFVPSATSALQAGILGLSRRFNRKFHVITSALEHKAVYDALQLLKSEARAEITVLPVDSYGCVRIDDLAKAIRTDTLLMVVQHANNEIGALQPIAEISRILRRQNVLLMVDASQSLVCQPLSAERDGCDLIVGSGHKMHGLRGGAFLYARAGAEPVPLFAGSATEGGLHPGTLNVPAIAGLGLAAKLAANEGPGRVRLLRDLAVSFLSQIRERVWDIRLNGHPEDRLPTNLSLTIPGVEAQELQQRTPHISFSRGSACNSQSGAPSHVLRAIGLTAIEIHWTFRIGLSSLLTGEEVARAGRDLSSAALALRGQGVPAYTPNLNQKDDQNV